MNDFAPAKNYTAEGVSQRWRGQTMESDKLEAEMLRDIELAKYEINVACQGDKYAWHKAEKAIETMVGIHAVQGNHESLLAALRGLCERIEGGMYHS